MKHLQRPPAFSSTSAAVVVERDGVPTVQNAQVN